MGQFAVMATGERLIASLSWRSNGRDGCKKARKVNMISLAPDHSLCLQLRYRQKCVARF